MPQKSFGKMARSRNKMKMKEKPSITRYLARFKAGDTVHISYVSSSPLPHPRFQGLTGKVVEKRGRSYGVKIKDGNKPKVLYLRPEHIKKS